MSIPVADAIRSIAEELADARQAHVELADGAAPKIAVEIRLHCERLEGIEASLSDAAVRAASAARSHDDRKPNIPRVLDEIRYLRNTPKAKRDEIDLMLDRIASILQGMAP